MVNALEITMLPIFMEKHQMMKFGGNAIKALLFTRSANTIFLAVLYEGYSLGL